MGKFLISEKAVQDLTKIWNYTFEVWSENQADKYYELLIDAFMEISNSPDIGKKYEEIETNILGFGVGKHIIFYQKIKPKEVFVIRILHEQMDLKSRMEE